MNFVAIDVETANANRHSVCSLAMAVSVDHGGPHPYTNSFWVNPEEAFDARNTRLHGIGGRKLCEGLPRCAIYGRRSAKRLPGRMSAVTRHSTCSACGNMRNAIAWTCPRMWPGGTR